MNYSKFLTLEEIKNFAKKYDKNEIICSGLPIYSENNQMYYIDNNKNNLIFAVSNSGVYE